jgi:hypothetical protein
MAAITVGLGGITFGRASAAADSDGDKFTLRNLDGWTTPNVELVAVEKPVSAGAVLVSVRYTARTVTIAGHGIASNADGIWRVRNKLAALADTLRSTNTTLTVTEPTATYTLSVRLAEAVRVRTVGPRVIEFELVVFAADPTKATVPP